MPPELADSLRAVRSLVSPYTGVVRGAEEVLAVADDVRLVNVFCSTGDGIALTGTPGATTGGGSGTSLEEALVAAVAEAAERYSACWCDGADTVVATARELGARAVAPERFALFSARQHRQPGFPYAPFTRDTRVAWVEATSLADGGVALVPAQLVYLAWELRPGEERIARSTSNGLAAHVSRPASVLSGLFELVERDAFMITWGARIAWPQLTWDAHVPLARYARRYLEPSGIAFATLDMSEVWNVPCVLGVARSGARGQAPLGVGAAAASTVERAVRKALDEAFRVRSWARAQRALDPQGDAVVAPDAMTQFDEHVGYYARDEHAARAAFLDASAASRAVESVRPLPAATDDDAIAELCARLAAQGASAYAIEVTAPDVAEAGLTVTRVLAPELCPLDVEHRHRHLGGRRRYDVPFALGLRPARLREDDLNPDPHPFP